jgi:hypothetical protein
LITLDAIYRDIVSKINQGSKDDELTRTDILNAINDAAASLRNDYVSSGLGQSFSITDSITSIARDATYPFLYVGTLTKELIKRVAISKGIINMTAYYTNTELLNEAQTAVVGATAFKNTATEFSLYRCVKSFTTTNTYTATFDKSKLRQWRSQNGLKYLDGDVVFDGSNYWRIGQNFTNDQPYTFTEPDGSFLSSPGPGEIQATKMYWIYEGDATTNPVFFEFDRVNELRLLNRDGFRAYTVKDNKIYTTAGVQKFNITYVPEWTYIDDLTVSVRIPFELIEPIKQRALAALSIKLRERTGVEQ